LLAEKLVGIPKVFVGEPVRDDMKDNRFYLCFICNRVVGSFYEVLSVFDSPELAEVLLSPKDFDARENPAFSEMHFCDECMNDVIDAIIDKQEGMADEW